VKKEVILGVDYNDHLDFGARKGFLYGESHIRSLVRSMADAGVTTVSWRVSLIGQVTYRSKVRTVVGACPAPMPEMYPGSAAGSIVIQTCDPPAVAVNEARKCGVKIVMYVTLFDEYFPGMESKFEMDHPEYTWRHRFGKDRIRGLLSYAYPEVREHRLAEIRELLAYEPDGIYLDTGRSHCGIQPIMAMPLTGGDPYWQYGFNEPEVAEFKRRYGADPGSLIGLQPRMDDVNFQNWNKLRGEYLTQFLRETRAVVNQAGKQLTVGFYSDAECYLSPVGRRGRVPLGLFHHDYETWAKENLVDGFVIVTEHRRYGGRDWREHSSKQFSPIQRSGKKVYIWGATQARVDELEDSPVKVPVSVTEDRPGFLKAMRKGIEGCMEQTADGVFLYEALHPEEHEYWTDLKDILHGRA